MFTMWGRAPETKLRFYLMAVLGLFAVLLLGSAACRPAPASTIPTEYTIMTMNLPGGGGDYLVDGSGRTLYYFTRDSAGKSSANEAVLLLWPIFYTAQIKFPSNLNAADFSSITRQDGEMQTTYKGWPLYYYAADSQPGETKGQGVGGVWFVVNPATIPAAP